MSGSGHAKKHEAPKITRTKVEALPGHNTDPENAPELLSFHQQNIQPHFNTLVGMQKSLVANWANLPDTAKSKRFTEWDGVPQVLALAENATNPTLNPLEQKLLGYVGAQTQLNEYEARTNLVALDKPHSASTSATSIDENRAKNLDDALIDLEKAQRKAGMEGNQQRQSQLASAIDGVKTWQGLLRDNYRPGGTEAADFWKTVSDPDSTHQDIRRAEASLEKAQQFKLMSAAGMQGLSQLTDYRVEAPDTNHVQLDPSIQHVITTPADHVMPYLERQREEYNADQEYLQLLEDGLKAARMEYAKENSTLLRKLGSKAMYAMGAANYRTRRWNRNRSRPNATREERQALAAKWRQNPLQKPRTAKQDYEEAYKLYHEEKHARMQDPRKTAHDIQAEERATMVDEMNDLRGLTNEYAHRTIFGAFNHWLTSSAGSKNGKEKYKVNKGKMLAIMGGTAVALSAIVGVGVVPAALIALKGGLTVGMTAKVDRQWMRGKIDEGDAWKGKTIAELKQADLNKAKQAVGGNLTPQNLQQIPPAQRYLTYDQMRQSLTGGYESATRREVLRHAVAPTLGALAATWTLGLPPATHVPYLPLKTVGLDWHFTTLTDLRDAITEATTRTDPSMITENGTNYGSGELSRRIGFN